MNASQPVSTVSCPFCQHPLTQLVCQKPDRAQQFISIRRCAACTLLFGWPFPTEQELGDLYTDDYFQCDSPLHGGYENYQSDEPEIKKTFLRRWKALRPYLSHANPLRVLDVGCATGIFLDVAHSQGADVIGVERSTFGAMETKKKGFSVFEGQLAAAPLEAADFDLITLWDVIEHVPDPVTLLAQCRRLLKADGILALSTPDASAPLARFLGHNWLGFRSVGEHLYFFGRKTMRDHLEKAGYEVLEIQAVGKYMKWDRLLRRLGYYTRVFEWLRQVPLVSSPSSYFSSGDTMYVIARIKK